MAIALTLRGFNDLGRSVTPIFLSKGHFFFSRILNILQNAPSNSVHLTYSFSCAAVSNASLRVKVSENDGKI